MTATGLGDRTELFFRCCLTQARREEKSVGADCVLVPTYEMEENA